MFTDEQRQYLAKAVVPMQIIVGAMASGVMMFAVVVLAREGGDAPDEPTITYVALVISVASLAASFFVPNLVARAARDKMAKGQEPRLSVRTTVPFEAGIVGQLAKVFQVRLIITCAILEGPALFCLIAYMTEGSLIVLVVAALLFFSILSRFPTPRSLEDWIAQDLESIEQMRS